MCEAEKSEDIPRVFIGKQTGDSSKILLEVNAGWDVSYKSTTEHKGQRDMQCHFQNNVRVCHTTIFLYVLK